MKMEKQSETQSRNPPVWSREKINNLIELYKKHDCLWNHWHESYKDKEKRKRSIEEICTALRITKFDFGKKIHNLRNQFNTEMKKLELRIEAGGESVDSSTSMMRCKWSHFESLMFLRDVIEPRPSGYQNTLTQVPPKKMRFRFDYNSAEDDVNVTMLSANASNSVTASNDDISQCQYEEDNTGPEEAAAATEDFQNFENELNNVGQPTREESYDKKYQPPTQQQHTSTTSRCCQINSNNKTSPICQHTHPSQATTNRSDIINLSHDNAPIIELSSQYSNIAPSSSCAPVVLNTPAISSVASVVQSTNNTPTSSAFLPVARDQWDAFGELVASEFRNLNSDISRKRLKRRIMQAMLEVGEEDDAL